MSAAPRRAYDGSRRREAAARTRAAILDAALELFRVRGYAGTTVQAIASAAGVAVDTVYAAVGMKAAVLRLLVERALSGSPEAVPARERAYVREIIAEPDAGRKLARYGVACGEIAARLGPVFEVIVASARSDREVGDLWREISTRRAANMRELAAHLATTGRVRAGLSLDEAADVLWSLNAPEFYLLLLRDRGWTAERFGRWLGDAWQRLLLEPARPDTGAARARGTTAP